jgi:hypothetical protein
MSASFRLILLSLVILTGCGHEAAPPARMPPPAAPSIPVSTFAAILTVPAGQLTRLLDNMTEYQIADLRDQPVNCGFTQCRLNLQAVRSGPALVSADDGLLRITMPFATHANLASKGFLSFLNGQAEGHGRVLAHAELDISPDMQLHAKTGGTVDLDGGHLRLGPIVTNVTSLWNHNQAALSQPLWHSFDRQIGRLPLKAAIAKFWTAAFKPIRVAKSPVAWLVLRPKQVILSQPLVRGGVVTISMGLVAEAHVAVQETPPDNLPAPLSRADIGASPSNDFSFAVPVLLSYDEAAKLTLISLAKRPPRIAGLILKFSELSILPSKDGIVVYTKFCADPNWDPLGWFASCARVYLRGRPVFDAAHKAIQVANLHYDIASADLMFRVMHMLAGDDFVSALQSHLVFLLADRMDRLQQQITVIMAKPEGRDVAVSAKLETFGDPQFTWTRDGFLAVLTARGKSTATLNL